MSENIETTGCVPKMVQSWRTLVTTFTTGHKIHPSNQQPLRDCEFIVIDSKIQIRVVHVCPGYLRKSIIVSQPIFFDSKRCSLSEEYWFSRWNKPLKIGNCNCSFRRSVRCSVTLSQPLGQNIDRTLIPSIELPPTKIKNIATFVERLIQDTFFEACHEYYMLRTKDHQPTNSDNGKVNLGYEITDEDNVVITLRRKLNDASKNDFAANKTELRNSFCVRKTCVHKKALQKPLVIMFHGIGTSADIWTIVINAMTCRGYEVVAPDMLGHGFSSAPLKSSYYTFNNLLLQALTIFDYYMADSKRKCILIGHSYGCSLITAMYPHRAQQISQLVLISGGGPIPLAPYVKDDGIPPFGFAYTLLHPLLYCGVKRSIFFSSRGKHFKVCDDENGLPRHVIENIAIGQKWSQGDTAFHRRITAPTLLVHGLQDPHVTLVQECEMERTIPRAFLELIPNAGHLPMIETPEHLIHMIICFLDMWS
ncbi:protein ABHD8-like [Diabrotica virgifera virgifera]|uniref:acylglycerol lipase n=1 Tax=Diabrotica virgifera virgifera TaxID=50390 RepID=A0A6P7GI53_DIAVI|nr:protein ABHD8-like [Diabrotica virgifera virgifera]